MNWKAGDGENITLNYPITLQNKTLIAVLSDTSGKIDASSNEGAYIVQYSSKDVEIRNAWSNNYANTITAIFILGFQKQWGFITQTGTDISIPFPVSFSELLSIANAGSYTWNGEDNWITKSTANGFTASHEVIKVEFRWIAIGRQAQWGTGTDSYNVVFPVQFTAEVFALAGIVQEDYNGGRDTMTYANLTTAGFLMIINTSYPAKYIAIGR